MTDKEVQLSRGAEVLNRPVQTSLAAFMESKISEVKSDEQVSESTEVTESEVEAVSEESGTEFTDSTDNTFTTDNSGDTVTSEEDKPSDELDTQEFEVGEQKVKLKDLLNSYETREQISKRFAEVGLKEKRLADKEKKVKEQQAELDFINEKFDEARDLIYQGNSIAALQVLLSMTPKEDENPKTMQELIEQAVNIADNFHSMSDEERTLFFKNEELASKERKLTRAEKKRAAREEEEKLTQYYTSVLDAHKIQDAEIQQAVEDISKIPQHAAEYDKRQTAQERIDYCASWIVGKRIVSTIKDGIGKVRPDLKENQEFVLAILNEVDANCTVEDVSAIVKEFNKLASNTNSEAKAAASKKDVTPKVTTPNRAPTEGTEAKGKFKPGMSLRDLAQAYNS